MSLPLKTDLRLSVSSWALHELIGTVAPGRPGDPAARLMAPRDGVLALVDVPAALASRGIFTMEMCHFHLAETSDAYLSELRGALESAGVELWSFLIDDADLTHPEHFERDREWVASQIEIAGKLGARCCRVIAGKQPTSTLSMRLAVEQLTQLSVHAFVHGVRVMTENWFALLPEPEPVHALLGKLQGAVGLTLDFGNWTEPDKYFRLEQIARHAEGCHAKCSFTNGAPDTEDFSRCLEITRAAAFSGPYTLVHGEPGDIWGSLERQRELVAPFLAI